MPTRPFNPGKVRLRSCTIKGTRVDLLINCIRLYETMCKPYFTAQIMVIDNINMINNLQLKGGDKVSFSFHAEVTGQVIAQDQYILSIDGEEPAESLRAVKYTIYTASASFFKDKANIVQRSVVNITGSALAASIHEDYVGGDFPLSVHSSTGMIAQSDIGGYQVNGKKPFKAIQDVLDRSVGGGVSTGSWMYFMRRNMGGRNDTSNRYVMCPLETLFNSRGSQETFWQKNTWGSEFEHTLGGGNPSSDHAIIAAKTVIKEKESAGRRGGGANIAKTMAGALNIWEITTGSNPIANFTGSSGGGGGGAASMAANFSSKRGGMPNFFQNDARRNPMSTNQNINAVAENAFQGGVKDSTNYLIKVPIQTGINVTVGLGADAHLIPPIGDVLSNRRSEIPPNMLVADAMHECYFDQRLLQATSTFRLVKGI